MAVSYGTYSVHVNFFRTEGILQIPLADDGEDTSKDTCVLVRTSAPYSKKVVRFLVSATGDLPDLPDPTPQEPGEVLLESTISPVCPTPTTNVGGNVFTVSGCYVYGSKRPYSKTTGYTVGLPPVYKGTMRVNYNTEHFKKGII